MEDQVPQLMPNVGSLAVTRLPRPNHYERSPAKPHIGPHRI